MQNPGTRLDPRSLVGQAGHDVRSAERSTGFKWLVRAGFLARGVTYGLMGALALALAFGVGTRGAQPNQQGALSVLARSTLGTVALVLICAGVLCYAAWKITRAASGYGPEGGGSLEPKDRLADLFGGIGYIGFLVVALRTLTGSSRGSSGASGRTAAGVLGWTGGQEIVAAVGAVMIAVSLYQLWDALRGGFADDSKTERMRSEERRLFMLLGRIGLSARAIVFVLIGYFLLQTAIDFTPRKTAGINDALARLHHEPYGPWLVGLVGIGLLIFAAFSFFEARYRRL